MMVGRGLGVISVSCFGWVVSSVAGCRGVRENLAKKGLVVAMLRSVISYVEAMFVNWRLSWITSARLCWESSLNWRTFWFSRRRGQEGRMLLWAAVSIVAGVKVAGNGRGDLVELGSAEP